MNPGIPEHLLEEQRAVESAIRTAFARASRAGGVSWSEADVIDDCGSAEDRAAARRRDTDTSWQSLVDDPRWDHEVGVGGFCFLDPIGFRYYIAPAMIRCSRTGSGEFIAYALTMDSDYSRRVLDAVNTPQARAVARFVRFMIAVHEATGDDIYGAAWQKAYDSHWRSFWP